jgi:hypothetical protein
MDPIFLFFLLLTQFLKKINISQFYSIPKYIPKFPVSVFSIAMCHSRYYINDLERFGLVKVVKLLLKLYGRCVENIHFFVVFSF